MKQLKIGNLVVTYIPTSLSIVGAMMDLMNGKPVLCIDPYGTTLASISRLKDDSTILDWSIENNDWEESSCVLLDRDITYYSVCVTEVTQPQWYELPGVFAEPVVCVVSDDKITPDKYVGGNIRYVRSYDSDAKLFLAMTNPQAPTNYARWRYAIPVSQINTK